MIKRPPSGKHFSLSIEAPITKVINIILAAQENQPSYIVQALYKVKPGVMLLTLVHWAALIIRKSLASACFLSFLSSPVSA